MKKLMDERQEIELLKIEHIACWLMFWGITADMLIGTLTNNMGLAYMVMIAVFFVTCLYMLFSCIRKGIWDRHIKPTFKNNCILSLITALICTPIFGRQYARNMASVGSSPFTSSVYYICIAFSAFFVFALTLAALSFFSGIYKKRLHKLEEESDSSED